VASFGGALHAAVTTYYYLEIGASELDIGQIGFVISAGSLFLSPFAGHMLDQKGPFFPISLAAISCSIGCCVRGMAHSVGGLILGAIFLGIGVNLWTVVLAHLVNSFDRSLRSEVLSGFAVQTTCLQLLGKGFFPPFDWLLRKKMNFGHKKNVLPRYRLHMGLCTFFCFIGTFALILDRKNVNDPEKHSIGDDCTGSPLKLSHSGTKGIASSLVEADTPLDLKKDNAKTEQTIESSECVILGLLVFGLLCQSIGTTVLSVLWPFVVRDRYGLSVSEFGILEFVSSLLSTCAVASFPSIERLWGRKKTAALCAATAAACGAIAFCVSVDFSSSKLMDKENKVKSSLTGANFQFLICHAFMATIFRASLFVLEPCLKSMLSLAVPAQSQGRCLGYMATLGSIGGMTGNVVGTWLFHVSKQVFPHSYDGGILPFAAVTVLLAMASLFFYCYGEVKGSLLATDLVEDVLLENVELGRSNFCSSGDPPLANESDFNERQNMCSLILQRETTYDLKLD